MATEVAMIDPRDKESVIIALQNYKKQNPKKYAEKEAELFRRYGLDEGTNTDEIKDESDVKLEEIKEAVKTKKSK